MLKGQNDALLKQKGIKEIAIPFYQRWQELVNEKTLDIYQYRVLTSLSALEELADVLEKTIAGVFINDANIEACRAETLYILNTDLIMRARYKVLTNRLKANLGSKPKNDADKVRMLAQVRYAINQIKNTYVHYAVDGLKHSIINADIDEMDFYANMIASQAVHNGWSPQALNDLLRFFREDKDFDNQWELFKSHILDKERKWHDVLIHVPFRNQRNEGGVDTFGLLYRLGLNLCTYDELVEEYNVIGDIRSLLNSEKRYFKVNVSAFDTYSAAHVAIGQISNSLNMASFYNLVSAWNLSSVSIVVINKTTQYHKAFNAEQLYKTYDYLDGSSKVFEHTKNIFTDAEKNVLKEKLTGAFGYANISRASLFQEEKYMNLWVALESLARTKMYPDIISCVKQTVPAAMTLRYIYRIIRNYVEDCIRCKVKFDFVEHNIDMKQDTKQKLVKETIEIFRNQDLYDILLKKTEGHSLLKYRTEKIYELLNDVKLLKGKVKNHHDRVEWQIQRLYRIRNEIVHSALQNETSLIMYIEHLYDYLSTFITEIVTYVYKGKHGTLDESLAMIKDNYDAFISLVDQGDEALLEEKVLKLGVINLL